MSEHRPVHRFAVLHHTGVAHEHYDLLIETSPEAPLRTWRADSWPLEPEAIAERLPDHRRIYLEYEGLVSGGRGEVARVDEGTCDIEVDSPDEMRARLRGRGGELLLRLEHAREQRWIAYTKPL